MSRASKTLTLEVMAIWNIGDTPDDIVYICKDTDTNICYWVEPYPEAEEPSEGVTSIMSSLSS